jgi:glycosyltransferase involved in cell wall biosynthesis
MYTATLVITTRNRKDELRNALASAITQTAKLEIIVFDDASDDGTAEMVRSEFPGVRLEAQRQRMGYIRLRNLGASMASAPVIFSIDDDAIFTTPNVAAQVLAQFDDPRVGAVAIPFVDVRVSSAIRQMAPREGLYVAAMYIGTAHAIRRDVFFEVGQYREFFEHQFEEPDFCRRMLSHGYVVRLGRSDVIHHFFSPKRDFGRLAYYSARNNILLTWCTVPWPQIAWRLPRSVLGSLAGAIFRPNRRSTIRGVAAGIAGVGRYSRERTPVGRDCWRLLRRLAAGPVEIDEAARYLPRVAPFAPDGPQRELRRNAAAR